MNLILIFLSLLLLCNSFKINFKDGVKKFAAGTIIATTIVQPVQAFSYMNDKFDHRIENKIDTKNEKNDITYGNIDKVLFD